MDSLTGVVGGNSFSITVNSIGTELIIGKGSSGLGMHLYTLATPFDISSAIYVSKDSLATTPTYEHVLVGNYIFTCEFFANKIRRAALP